MVPEKGMIVLMGSGELTATMVEVHKELLGRFGPTAKAAFLDTPAGFQLNVDQISQKAQEYFQAHVQQPLAIASYKSNDAISLFETEQAYQKLRDADFVLIGPGSPTYAVSQWQQSSIPQILTGRIREGGCLVAASAAALTVGRFTLPVYEIYKVGQDLHWVDGMDILKDFGFNLVVIPHWNNAEGGTHDTRFCFMGEPRFGQLVSLLPEDVAILGLDEHTACILDFENEEAVIKGIGQVTLQHAGHQIVFNTGDKVSLEVFREVARDGKWQQTPPAPDDSETGPAAADDAFWDQIHRLEAVFYEGLETHEARKTSNALLELDRMIWQAQQDLENPEFISQAREVFRELIVLLGTELANSPKSLEACLSPLVADLVELRENLRQKKQWKAADAVRQCLERSGTIIEDTKDGPQWRLKP